MANICYLIISPNPYNLICGFYYVKFGDGNGDAAYRRSNPDHAYVTNDPTPDPRLDVLMYEGKVDDRRPGKFLEWMHIKVTGGMRKGQRTEWHKLVAHPGQAAALRHNLCRMLQLFPYWNRWEEIPTSGVDQYTSEFENLVDQTWWIDNEEATRFEY
ncbi:hypothetical protein BDV11DRAFT_176236 [Aspergillus similis]